MTRFPWSLHMGMVLLTAFSLPPVIGLQGVVVRWCWWRDVMPEEGRWEVLLQPLRIALLCAPFLALGTFLLALLIDLAMRRRAWASQPWLRTARVVAEGPASLPGSWLGRLAWVIVTDRQLVVSPFGWRSQTRQVVLEAIEAIERKGEWFPRVLVRDTNITTELVFDDRATAQALLAACRRTR